MRRDQGDLVDPLPGRELGGVTAVVNPDTKASTPATAGRAAAGIATPRRLRVAPTAGTTCAAIIGSGADSRA
ncbi:hypothetical protein, partial [Nonomuraea sp. NPDC001023]|uniref:hypothetical protein n=1 Tax=Nonomuraea sp. NPDC001023 TaxID=3154770 RepID=UPI00331DA66E